MIPQNIFFIGFVEQLEANLVLRTMSVLNCFDLSPKTRQRLASKILYLFAKKHVQSKEQVHTRNSEVSQVLACDVGVDRLMCGEESSVGVFIGERRGINNRRTVTPQTCPNQLLHLSSFWL